MGTFTRQNFSDQLSIDTPEGVALQFPVAGMGSRAIAVLLDHVFQGVVYGIIIFGMVMLAAAAGSSGHAGEPLTTAGKWFVAGIIFLLFCVWWGYFALFEAFWRGQTPGKRIMKLRVIKDTGRQITLFEAVARNLLRIVDTLPAWYVVGVITMVCNKRNQRLGDLAAGTIVIHEVLDEQPMVVGGGTFITQPIHTPAEAWAAARAQDAAASGIFFPADALARLGPKDMLVIDTFFSRALDLPMDTRVNMAQRVAASLCAKMGQPLPQGNPERVLEVILAGVRSGARSW